MRRSARIVGLAGDRPDDTLRGVGRQVARRVDRFVQKEMLHYLRGRTRESVLGEIRAGALEGGWTGEIPVYGSRADGARAPSSTEPRTRRRPEVIVLLCHEDREGVYDLIADRGLRPVDDPAELAASSPAARRREGRELALRRLELAGVGEGRAAVALAGAGHGLAVDRDRVVDAHHDEVARVRAPERGLHRRQLVEDLVDPDRPAGAVLARPPDAVGDERRRRRRARGRGGCGPRGR